MVDVKCWVPGSIGPCISILPLVITGDWSELSSQGGVHDHMLRGWDSQGLEDMRT